MTEDGYIPDRVEGQPALDRVSAAVVAHREYTYRVFQDFEFGSRDLTQSIFTGSLWRSVRATGTCFRRCDFDGMQVEECAFEGADFGNADIRSSGFARCRFLRCRFDESLIDACSFDQCVFDACTFDSVAQRNCTFAECDLRNYSLARSSFTMCRLERSQLSGLVLADCTFLYIILRGCRLADVTVNVESLGTVFGITAEDLERLKLVHLGRAAFPASTGDLAGLIGASYEKQRWSLSLAVTRLNFRLTSAAYALAEYLRDVATALREGRRLRREEMVFLLDVLEVLLEEERLPLVALTELATVLQVAQGLLPKEPAAADQRLADDTIALLAAKTSALARSAMDKLASALTVADFEDRRPVLVECTYGRRPDVDLPALLRDATLAAGLPLPEVPVRVSTRRGSYIEVIQITLVSAFALQVLLYALNGILIQITEMKERVRVLRLRRAPRRFQILARTEQQALPAALRGPVKRLLDFSSAGSWLSKPDLDGLDERNVRQVQVVPAQAAPDDDSTPSSPGEGT